jgi:hypothetical protein
VGARMRVKNGVPDPDFSDIPLGGWAGTVAEADQDGNKHVYLIEWNDFTLDHMPPIFRKRCDRDGLELEESWLGEEDLESDVGDRLPLEQPTQIVTRPLRTTDQDDRIRAIFGLTSDDPLPESSYENLRHYHAYLAANLTFPFEAGYWEDAGPFESSRKRKVSVVDLANLDCYCPEEVGLLFRVRHDGEQTRVIQTRANTRRGVFGFPVRGPTSAGMTGRTGSRSGDTSGRCGRRFRASGPRPPPERARRPSSNATSSLPRSTIR